MQQSGWGGGCVSSFSSASYANFVAVWGLQLCTFTHAYRGLAHTKKHTIRIPVEVKLAEFSILSYQNRLAHIVLLDRYSKPRPP